MATTLTAIQIALYFALCFGPNIIGLWLIGLLGNIMD